MNKRHRLCVGVDYGTTFSGFAYATSRENNVNIITTWPGNAAGYREKVPSQIAYQVENNHIDHDVWGYEVPSGARTHAWTKLQLDRLAVATKYDDPSLGDVPQEIGMPMPKKKPAEEVVADYLTHFYQHCMEYLEKEVTKDLLKLTPIDFWFTMPALWSDPAQHATRAAAEKAGFGSRADDTISMIMEPEAAAVCALKVAAGKYDDLLKINTGILICDCGGGTVDITSYTIAALDPLKLEESYVGTGGKCGSTYVDRNLVKLLTNRYGRHYTSLPETKRGPGSTFMKDFETVRDNFNGSNFHKRALRLVMRDLGTNDPRCIQYDPDEAEVTITSDDLEECFGPVTDKLIQLIEEQCMAVKKEGNRPVESLVLVGGFGSSPYVWKVVKEWCEAHSTRLISPDRPWSAVARGAAMRGLEGAVPFNPRTEPRDEHVFFDPFTQQDWRGGWMEWQIKKGARLNPGEKKGISFSQTFQKGDSRAFRIPIFSCSLDDPPKRLDDRNVERVGVIHGVFDVDMSKLPKAKVKKQGHRFTKMKLYDLIYECEVSVPDEIGILQFMVSQNGRSCGKTNVEYKSF